MNKGLNMNFDDVIKGRRSTRGFLPKPVSREVLEDVVDLAINHSFQL